MHACALSERPAWLPASSLLTVLDHSIVPASVTAPDVSCGVCVRWEGACRDVGMTDKEKISLSDFISFPAYHVLWPPAHILKPLPKKQGLGFIL